ncbi:SMP-30/gluconolactonase/LRE family protein [Sphingobacterium sp. HMA12]|uniref:SMP-30/gluconolactonase/LRE family protein n=1 Tax=Sphingobacterium sp. HMA12 TaxID=2050894 RepID=UPI000CE9E1F4|nr:SMP-30/gluconolactonase/LRE family protein [Sphingobacterium sp. HMA12]
MESNLKTAQILINRKCVLGEGILWNKHDQCLYWVDILQKRIYSYHLESKESAFWELPGYVSKIVPLKDDPGKFLIAMQEGLAIWTKENHHLSILIQLDTENGQIRTNDGGMDPEGNFWIGTMHMKALPDQGKLMRLREGVLKTLIAAVTIPNGIVWSTDSLHFYFIDTYTREIRRYALDKGGDLMEGYDTLVRVPGELGMPDGMCMGPDGHLWVAHWGGFGVYKWHVKTGELLDKVTVNAPNVTSCCFGGPTGMDLFISTAQEGLGAAELEAYPDSGKIFQFKNLGCE